MFKTHPAALARLEEKRLALRKKYFGKREHGGLSFAWGSELTQRAAKPLDPADQSPFARAIREAWPDANPVYWSMIARRYRETYKDLPEEDATLAVTKGFSSPGAAMRARVIRKRTFVGFAGVQP